MRTISRRNQITDTTAQLYCTLSTYVTPKTISHQNQKTNTTPHLYCTLSMQVCKTKTYFPPEPKADTIAQLEKSSSSPRAASVFATFGTTQHENQSRARKGRSYLVPNLWPGYGAEKMSILTFLFDRPSSCRNQ